MGKRVFFGITVAILFTLLLVSCTPIGGTLDDIREKAWEENHGGEKTVYYTVIFDRNDATSGTAPSSQTVTAGSTITLPGRNDLLKTGYAFDGWQTTPDGGDHYHSGADFTVNSNVTLFVKWSTTLTVSYDRNGGSGTTPPGNTVQPGESITLPNGSGFSRSPYNFDGWNTQIDGKGDTYAANSPYTPDEGITLYARWTSTVTYNANFTPVVGSPPPPEEKVPAGSHITIPGPGTLVRTGYGFVGWNTNTGGTGTNYTQGESYTPLGGNIPLYAKWDANTYTVTFNKNHSDTTGYTEADPQTKTVTAPTTTVVTLPVPPTRAGYTFDSWNTQPGGGGSTFTAATTVTESIPVYAKWNPVTYTIAYNRNTTDPGGGGDMTNTISYTYGVLQSLKTNTFTRRSYVFQGWTKTNGGAVVEYTDGQPVDKLATTAGTVTLYAVWGAKITNVTDAVAGAGLNNKFIWLYSNAVSNTIYDVQANITNEPLAAGNASTNYRSLSYPSYTNVTINMTGSGSMRTVSLQNTSSGSLFTIGSGVTLVLGDNVTLQGHGSNNAALITVNSGGTLEMEGTATITGNTSTDGGGGVYVNNGSFTMSAGIISYNDSRYGGGVGVAGTGTFTMSNGSISHNTSSNGGGGVDVGGTGTFTMYAGTISHNTCNSYGGGVLASSSGPGFIMRGSSATISYNNAYSGDGVFISRGTFTMSDGTISYNTANLYGGGVHLDASATFNMSGGTISDNETLTYNTYGGGVNSYGTFNMSNNATITRNTSFSGGGVSLLGSGTLTMNNTSKILNNNATVNTGGYGGGVYIHDTGTFTMKNSTLISGNTAYYGGGVAVNTASTFIMEYVNSPTISGNTANSVGGGVYVYGTGTGTFVKNNGGTITGYGSYSGAGDDSSFNVVKDTSGTILSGCGHAVFITGSAKREKTVLSYQVLNWENSTATGDWAD